MSDTTNLWNIKKWYSYYSEDAEKLHQLGGELMKNENLEKTELRHHVVLESQFKA